MGGRRVRTIRPGGRGNTFRENAIFTTGTRHAGFVLSSSASNMHMLIGSQQGSSDFEYTGGVDLSDVNLTTDQQQLLAIALKCLDNFLASHQGRPYESLSEGELKILRSVGGAGGAAGMGAFSRSVRAMSMLGAPGMRRDSFDGFNQGQRFSLLGKYKTFIMYITGAAYHM